MRKNYFYNGPDDMRALLVDVDNINVRRTRLIIRADRGQGPVLLNRTYATHRGARAALTRRAAGWTCYRKQTY